MLLRRKWKYLRDQFAVEVGKYPPAPLRDVAGDIQTSKWQYFQLLLFLKDVVKPRPSTKNFASVFVSDAAEALFPCSSESGDRTDVEPTLDSEEGVPASPAHSHDTESIKLQYLIEKSLQKQDKDDDEDLMFFKSLLPHIKKIPDENKLTFRNCIQELVQQFAYPDSIFT